MEDINLTEKELETVYAFLSLEWESYTEEHKKSWTEILNIIEDNLEKSKHETD